MLTDLYRIDWRRSDRRRPCYVFEGTANEGKGSTGENPVIKSGLAKRRALRGVGGSESDDGQEVAEIEGRWYPVASVMEDKPRYQTEFIIKAIEFNPQIPAGIPRTYGKNWRWVKGIDQVQRKEVYRCASYQ